MARVTGKPIDRIMKSFVDRTRARRCSTVRSVVRPAAPARLSLTRAAVRRAQSAARRRRRSDLGPPRLLQDQRRRSRAAEVIDRPAQTITGGACGDTSLPMPAASGYYLTEYAPDAVRALTRSARHAVADRAHSVWSATSGGWSAQAATTSTATSISPGRSRVTRPAPSSARCPRGSQAPGDYPRRPRRIASASSNGCATRFGPVLVRAGLPGASRDDDQQQSRRASLLRSSASPGTIRSAAAGARSGREYLARHSRRCRRRWPATILRLPRCHGDRALYDRYMAQLQKLSGQSRGVLPLLQRAGLVPRSGAGAADAGLHAVAARSQPTSPGLIGRADGADWGRDPTWAFIKAQWPAMAEKLGTFQGIPRIIVSVGNFCSLRGAQTRCGKLLRAEPACPRPRGRCSRRSSGSSPARRCGRGSRTARPALAGRAR